MREAGESLGRSIAAMRRDLAQDRHYFTLATLDDIHARLCLLEIAVFKRSREWFELTPSPDDLSIAAALDTAGWARWASGAEEAEKIRSARTADIEGDENATP